MASRHANQAQWGPVATIGPTSFLRRHPRLRHTAIDLLAGMDELLHHPAADLSRPRIQFLMAHRLPADEERGFRRHLEQLLSLGQRFVSYSEAVDRLLTGRIDAPYVAFSFDDGFESCRWAGVILREYGTSACFFVCPSIIGEPDALQRARFIREQLNESGDRSFLSWRDLEALQVQNHEVGAHSLTHANLATLPHHVLEDEIGGCREALSRRVGTVRHFAWPFGHFSCISREAVRVAFAAGYSSCASAERGCHVTPPADARSLCIRRDQIMPEWPWRHVAFFLARNSREADLSTNQLPASVT